MNLSNYPQDPSQSAIREWQGLTTLILGQAQQLIDAFARVKRISEYNSLDDLIDAAEPGQLIGDSGLTKERAVVVRAVLASFGAWLITPLPDTPTEGQQITPLAAMSRRG